LQHLEVLISFFSAENQHFKEHISIHMHIKITKKKLYVHEMMLNKYNLPLN